MKKWGMVIGGAAVLSGILTGCGTLSASGQTHQTTVVEALSPVDKPNWWFGLPSLSGNYHISLELANLRYKPLVQMAPNNTIDYARSLAKTITVSSHDKVYTVDLNKKWHWSDGRPVTAQDVVWTVDIALAASKNDAPWSYANMDSGGIPTDIAQVKAIGPYTVQFVLNQSVNPTWFEHNGISQFWVLPQFVWNKYPKNMTKELNYIQKLSTNPAASPYKIVDGPFIYSSYFSDPSEDSWAFVPNSRYDGHKPSISRLVLRYFTNASAEFSALKQNEVNYGYLPFSMKKDIHQLSGDHVFSTYGYGFNYIEMNYNAKAPDNFSKIISHHYIREAL
ncbi:MAG: ABC transporter substrate-binding protein, partial [Firmicutes bacterium]|nr:ABC transporter substrate-binding protein [Bacillota bacterium]